MHALIAGLAAATAAEAGTAARPALAPAAMQAEIITDMPSFARSLTAFPSHRFIRAQSFAYAIFERDARKSYEISPNAISS